MLESSKDIYTVNLLIVAVQFLIVSIACRLTGVVSRWHINIALIHQFLWVHCIWWTLLSGFFESNITPLAFYAAVQFKVLVAFNWFGKLNAIYTVLILFCVLQFCFLFYPLIATFESKRNSKEILEFSKYKQSSFWFEMILKYLRGLFHALIHGCFINHHIPQLAGLFLFDITLLFITLLLRKLFRNRATFGISFVYLLTFLAFDVTLLVYSLELDGRSCLDDNR